MDFSGCLASIAHEKGTRRCLCVDVAQACLSAHQLHHMLPSEQQQA
jgi:hypothetical protein